MASRIGGVPSALWAQLFTQLMSSNQHPMLNVAVKAARAAGAIINRAALDVEATYVRGYDELERLLEPLAGDYDVSHTTSGQDQGSGTVVDVHHAVHDDLNVKLTNTVADAETWGRITAVYAKFNMSTRSRLVSQAAGRVLDVRGKGGASMSFNHAQIAVTPVRVG